MTRPNPRYTLAWLCTYYSGCAIGSLVSCIQEGGDTEAGYYVYGGLIGLNVFALGVVSLCAVTCRECKQSISPTQDCASRKQGLLMTTVMTLVGAMQAGTMYRYGIPIVRGHPLGSLISPLLALAVGECVLRFRLYPDDEEF